VSCTGEPRFAADGKFLGYRGITRDITADWHKARRVQDAEHMHHFAMQLARLGAWSVDLATLTVTWSEQVCAIHEVPAGFQCTVQQAIEFYAPAHRAIITRLFERCVGAGESFDTELQICTARGRELWVRAVGRPVRDEAGTIIGVAGAFQDIDAAKRQAEEHRRTAEMLQGTLQGMTDGFVAMDRDWRFTYMNPEAARIVRQTPEAALGRRVDDVFPGFFETPFGIAYRRVASERVTVELVEFYHPLDIWVRARAWPSCDGGLAASFSDITVQMLAENTLRQLNDELEERVRSRTAELERVKREVEMLTFAIAHDVRAPLMSISAFAQAIEWHERGSLSERSRKHLDRIQAAARRMDEMTEALLQLGRITLATETAARVDLTALACETWDMIAGADPGRTVGFHVEPGLEAIGVRSQLALVLQNLLANAWKFTARVEAARVEVGKLQGDGGESVFFVRDNGAGFDPAYGSKLFTPFQRLHTSDEYQGHGMGLAIVRKVIGLHGGTVWANSSPGCGAVFHFTIPHRRGEAGAYAAHAAEDETD
jgi:PAS domain S-box-containing protein